MTTAREQAREMAQSLCSATSTAAIAADAASDVWEPIVRELAFVAQQGTFIDDDSTVVERFEEALARAWEALE